MAAAMEYLVAEVMELSGNVASQLGRKRVIPRHIQLAVRADDELNQVCERESNEKPELH